MNSYTITNRTTAHSFGAYEGTTPEEALIAMYRDAGYGEDVVSLDDNGEIVVAEDHAELLDPSELEATEVQ